MRLLIMLVAATATGALSASAIQTVFPQTAQAVVALGGDLKNFKISEINPVQAYRDVMAKITSGQSDWMSQGSGSRWTAPTFNSRPFDLGALQPKLNIDKGSIQRAIDAGFASRVQQDIRRMQDISAYNRNPAGWRGIPPH